MLKRFVLKHLVKDNRFEQTVVIFCLTIIGASCFFVAFRPHPKTEIFKSLRFDWHILTRAIPNNKQPSMTVLPQTSMAVLPGEPPKNLSFKRVLATDLIDCGLTEEKIECWSPTVAHQKIYRIDEAFVDLTSQAQQICGIKANSSVICWQTPTGEISQSPKDLKLTQIDANKNSICGLKLDRTIICWGGDQTVQPPEGEFVEIALGGRRSCGLKADYSIVCWEPAGIDNLYPQEKYIGVVAGNNHFCGLNNERLATCWGENQYQQSSAPAIKFKLIESGKNHICGLTLDWSVVCWGDNRHLQTEVPSSSFEALTVSGNHNCGIKKLNKETVCWGQGYKTPIKTRQSTPIKPDNSQPKLDNPDILNSDKFQIKEESAWAYRIDSFNCQIPDQNLAEKILERLPYIATTNLSFKSPPTIADLKNNWKMCFLKINYENLGPGDQTFNNGCLLCLYPQKLN